MNFCIYSLLWNMDPLLHTWDKRTVKIMDFTGRTSSEEGEDRKIGRKDDGHSFLGCTWYNSYRLPSVEANDQWRLLCSLIGPFQQHFKEKTSRLAKKKVLFHQDNARVHTCSAPMVKFNGFRYELLPHSWKSNIRIYCMDIVACLRRLVGS